MTENDLPFEGVKVLDLSQGVAGPYCAMHLARNGADVIKVEPIGSGCWSRQLGRPTGDHTAHSVVVNRAKRSLAVDLKTAEGVAIVQRLARDCDVVLHNYRVGKIDKFGLDYASVAKVNPEVIYLWITGFGPKGPRADQPATDSVMQAYTGMMSINRGPTGVPQRIEMLAIDFSTGLYAFQGVAAALYRKAMKGRGAYIETSLLECALALQEGAMMEHHLQGGAAEPIGMPVGMFKTKDGYMSVNARREEHFQRLARLLGKEEWIADPRYADARARVKHRDELMAALRPIFETRTSDEWVELLSSIDILKAKVNTYEDLFKDPQVQAVDAVHWIENDTLGRVPMGTICGQRVPANGDPLTHAPHVGEHTREVLAELGYGAGDIEKLEASGVVGSHRA
ncbi:MAG TPA: CoA transferase [Burkholderiales bacterium]|nr:CoA transferase [Burkholderiales bacterium]